MANNHHIVTSSPASQGPYRLESGREESDARLTSKASLPNPLYKSCQTGTCVRPGEQIACDVASSSIFGQNTLFPGSWCRIYVNVTHDLWLAVVTFYPETKCDQYGTTPPICWTAAKGYLTRSVHLAGLEVGGTYEYDACGALGVNVANCGWRQITKQDKIY